MAELKRAPFFVLIALAATTAFADEHKVSFEADVQPFLKKHCFDCHGPEQQEARIQYDTITGYAIEQQHLWTKVHQMLTKGEMPPEDETQPTTEEVKTVLRWIEQQADATQKQLGKGSLRRLNRRELSAALQDVTGLSVNYADGLPGDSKINGFDIGAEALQDAADSVAATMTATRHAVDGIYFLEKPGAQTIAVDFREVKDVRKAFDAWKEDGVSGKFRGTVQESAGVLTEPKWLGEKGGQEIYVPAPPNRHGVLRLKLVVSAFKPIDGVPDPHLWVEVGAKDIDFREITASAEKPLELIYEVQVDDIAVQSKGIKIVLANKVEIPYGIKGFENEDKSKPDEPIPGGPGLFRPAYDKKKTPLEKQPVPYIAIQSIEIQPNYVARWPPESWNAGIGEVTDDTASAQRLLNVWIERAWRRPVGNAEQQRFLALYDSLRRDGMTFDDALRATFQSVLLSSGFRYLASPADEVPIVAQHAIASRLSFMLIGAPPDEQLRHLAVEGKLRDAKVLDTQVDRLLADPRSEHFVRPFVTQWLVMDQPITLVMDYFQKQDFRFGRYLKESMREETLAYITEMLRENRPAKELIDSDWTMMNNSLAVHYGYDGIDGGQLRKVKLRRDDPRGGGILSHGGIQSMLCWMGENWVIYRGAWALRHIFDDAPPPPPLEVPELIPSDKENQGKSFRELLVQHQGDAKCSVCHRKMDPLGFAFQNFDISGRWREKEFEKYIRNELDGKIEWRGAGKSRPVDATGKLPRGEAYENYDQFKQLTIKHYMPDIVGGLLKNLMLYATGRQAGVKEMAEIQTIIRRQQPSGYRLRELVKEVVRSEAFLQQ